jgi:hypothetical protein
MVLASTSFRTAAFASSIDKQQSDTYCTVYSVQCIHTEQRVSDTRVKLLNERGYYFISVSIALNVYKSKPLSLHKRKRKHYHQLISTCTYAYPTLHMSAAPV